MPACLDTTDALRDLDRSKARRVAAVSGWPPAMASAAAFAVDWAALLSAAARAQASSSAWLAPWARVGGIECAASPMTVTRPLPQVGGTRCLQCGKKPVSSSVTAARTARTCGGQSPNRSRSIASGLTGGGVPGVHLRSNHHWSSPSPAGISPQLPGFPTNSTLLRDAR